MATLSKHLTARDIKPVTVFYYSNYIPNKTDYLVKDTSEKVFAYYWIKNNVYQNAEVSIYCITGDLDQDLVDIRGERYQRRQVKVIWLT